LFAVAWLRGGVVNGRRAVRDAGNVGEKTGERRRAEARVWVRTRPKEVQTPAEALFDLDSIERGEGLKGSSVEAG
jgi:hypothetical protein